MSWFENEIAAAKHQKKLAEDHRISEGRGLHAFVFLSFILAEALKLVVEKWIEIRGASLAEILFLLTITILTAQYWWSIYESAFFYGKNVFNFGWGSLEVAMFYAIAYLLRNSHSLIWPFRLFATMLVMFTCLDLLKYWEYVPKNQRTFKSISPRQLFRLIGVILAVLAGTGLLGEALVAGGLLALVFIYMATTGYARSKA